MTKTRAKDYVLEQLKSLNWIKGAELRAYTLLSGAELRQIICELRNEGYLIIASSKGYKIAKDHKEVVDYLRSRFSEIRRELETLNLLKKRMENLGHKSFIEDDPVLKSYFEWLEHDKELEEDYKYLKYHDVGN